MTAARSITRRAQLVAAALLTAIALLLALVLGSPAGGPSVAGAEPPADTKMEPLLLTAGTYTFTVQDIGDEVTSTEPGGPVLQAAATGAPVSWQLSFESSGRWNERPTRGEGPTRSFDGQRHLTTIDGETSSDTTAGGAAAADVESARAAGSSMPAGGPRLELNPYGASFLVHLARAGAQDAMADGLQAGETTSEGEACGGSRCTRITIQREVTRPADDSVYLWSLPWDGDDVETTVVVFEPDTQIVHLYETTFDDVVLHRFVLDGAPA